MIVYSLKMCRSGVVDSLDLNPSKSLDRQVQWRQVIWGLILQFVFGLMVLRWPTGRHVFNCIGQRVSIFLNFTNAGADFVYGHLTSGRDAQGHLVGTVFAFKVNSFQT